MFRCDTAQGKLKYVSSSQWHINPPRSPFAEGVTVGEIILGKTTNASFFSSTVAKIDAVQAEYSAFETLHETDNLISTARELDIAYVAYSPLGHGWLVDDFPYESPEDFAPDDFRRTGKLLPFPLSISSRVHDPRDI
jgi:aryl-alcohol dehydrogenase-like predicted oxidoreductase